MGEVVGKEAEDLTRHDKWLCMMYPRLVLLRQLLADDGAIFISIDDNEQANLKLICDEIFGAGNFVANMIWQSRTSISNDYEVSMNHNHSLIYSKNRSLLKFGGDAIDQKDYDNPDNDPRGPYKLVPIDANHVGGNTLYSIRNPNNGVDYYPPNGRIWCYNQETMKKLIDDGRIKFGRNNNSAPKKKLFLYERIEKGDKKTPSSVILDAGTTKDGTNTLMNMFGKKIFDYPKSVRLIEKFINYASDKSSIILDSFAGSGTTAHAVLNLNKQDGGNRKFILVEMEDYAENITAERVRRVIIGYGEGKNAVDGTGGSFSYYELGEPIFDENQNLNENVGVEKLREYIWYSETRVPYNHTDNSYLLGNHDGTDYYFYYKPDRITTLSLDTLNIVEREAETYVIYADQCVIDKEWLNNHHIIFKKIPRDIRRF